MDVQPRDLKVLDLEVADHRPSDRQPAYRQGADGAGANGRCPDRGRADANRCELRRCTLLPAAKHREGREARRSMFMTGPPPLDTGVCLPVLDEQSRWRSIPTWLLPNGMG